jgi:hypothetical protein
MNISASDIRYTQALETAYSYFGKDTVTRQEVLSYQESTGNNFPAKFWSNARIGRGVFSLKSNNVQQTNSEPTASFELRPMHVHAKHERQTTTSKFSLEAMVPFVKETFVEWGNYKNVKKLVASNEFFTLYITGDSGSGKNEMVDQVCANLKKPIVRVSITRETKEEHLIGSKTLVDGSIVYEEGPVKWAAENGAVLLLDEISAGDPNELMCLQAIMEGQPFFVKAANVLVTPAKGFCIIATDNTKGRGSDSGRYIGTNVLNDAFLERFEMTMEQGYPTERIERLIIEKLMSSINLVDDNFTNRLITWVHAIRKTYVNEGLEEHITTRRACHIVRAYKKLQDANLAIELCTNRFDDTTKQAMISLWDKLDSTTPAVETPV